MRSLKKFRSITLVTIFALAFATAFFVIPPFFVSEAGPTKGKGLIERTSSHTPGLENYDIRTDKKAYQKLAVLRTSNGRSAAMVADVRDRLAEGENELRRSVPNLKVEYNDDLKIPEVISPAVSLGKQILASASGGKRSDQLKNFIKENSNLFGVRHDQVDELIVAADYTNPDGNLSFVELNQKINGVPVFRGEVKAGFSKQGELFRVINNLAPGVDDAAASSNFGEPAAAAISAARTFGRSVSVGKVDESKSAASDDTIATVEFADGTSAQAERMYFPTEPGVVVPAWRVMIGDGVASYYAIVDAETGTLLWRKNLTEDQTQSATYNVYVNPNAMINVADNPFPLTPGPINPGSGAQGAALNRTSITLIGNEAPFTFNNNGWITDGDNVTDGNNVQAGLDRKLPNVGNPANPGHLDPDGMAVGTSRVFNFPFVPGNPNTNAGDSPLPGGQTPTGCLPQTDTSLPTDYQKAITTQLFYITNRFHDETYLLGFTEAARNFQHDNFGRQGVAGDRISAQAQDCSGTNNANFTTPSDGNRPTMQMYLWTGPIPDFDGSLDADVVIHEITHGVSNRLHGNSSGLSTNMARGMGEGWGDFFAHAMLSEPTDDANGVYTTGGYATYLAAAGFNANYYYGIRRYPKSLIASTGGANNKPHNAYTFSYINSNCNTRMNNTNFAYNKGAFGSATCDQVHNIGEIWSSMLWEARGKFVDRLGWSVGNRKMLQFVMDGMKLAPLAPTLLTERDAIILAAQNSSLAPEAAADVSDLWAGFAARGLGFSASIQNVGSGSNNTAVTDGFDLPNLLQTPAATISDATTGDNDGVPEPGETVRVTIPLSNTTGQTAENVSVTLVGGGTLSYGSIAHNGTASHDFTYTIPSAIECGSSLDLTINVTSSLGPVTFTRSFALGTPTITFTENFDGVTAPAFPAGWTVATELGAAPFVNSTAVTPDTAPNSAFVLDPTAVGGATSLTSPAIAINSGAAILTFRNRYLTEAGWDGGVLEISIGGGAFQDILVAGGTFLLNGYTGTLGNGTNNPLAGRQSWNGNSNGFITTSVKLPAAADGQNVQLRWRFGADDNTAAGGANPGWNIDTVQVAGDYSCSTFQAMNVRSDFDGDGRTDMSVFRPSNGGWYLLGSTQNFFGYNWGLAADIPVPADYDQDGKTDVAVFRPDAAGTFWILNSNGFTVTTANWGSTGDIPVVRDYDGDEIPDVAVYRPSDNQWYIQNSTGGTNIFAFGEPGDIPVAGDFDGDGKGDATVYRGGAWISQLSGGGTIGLGWGLPTDQPVPADYDGDGKDDMAVYRPESGSWWIFRSSDAGYTALQFGLPADRPVPGDYDGDGKADIAIYRDGGWWIAKSSGGFDGGHFGTAADKPTVRGYIP